MNRLLIVFERRLLRDRIFLLALAVTFFLSMYISFTNAPAMAEWARVGGDISLEDCYYNLAPLLGLMYASFISLFLGVEQSDGTLRNKLIAGHSRNSVFLSSYIISAIGCLMIMAAWLIGSLPGLFYFDGFSFGWKTYILYVLVSVCGALLYAAIFSAMSMLIPNKALGAVLCLVLWFVMLFVGSSIVNLLDAPEMIYDYIQQGNEWVPGEPYPNPNYVRGMKRSILEVLSRIIPICPSIQMDGGNLQRPVPDIIYALSSTAITLFLGCLGFRKKDIK